MYLVFETMRIEDFTQGDLVRKAGQGGPLRRGWQKGELKKETWKE